MIEARTDRPPASLMYFVAQVATHARIALGEIPNPVTREATLDLDSVSHCIALLEVLEEKTEGNRTSDESEAIESTLHDLRMRLLDAEDAG